MPKIVADMYVPPAFRRWGARFALAVLIAIAIGYLPGQVVRRDPRAAKLDAQIEQLTTEARGVAVRNAALRRQIAALRSDIGAIEDRARADLGLVYPDEVVFQLPPEPELAEQPEAPGVPGAPAPPGAPVPPGPRGQP